MGVDIISVVQNNIGAFLTPVQMVVATLIGMLFVRKKNSIETSTQEFEKAKAEHMREVTDVLLQSGELSYTEYYKMDNYLKIAEKADEFFAKIEETEQIPQQNYDWHVRFFENSGNIGDEELQMLWAKLLAGEICNPGSYSLRTLDCLKNLSKEEAKLFERVCGSSLLTEQYVYIPRIDSYLEENKISYDDILALEDCGLIKSDAMISMDVHFFSDHPSEIIAMDNEEQLVAKSTSEETDNLEIPEYLFTKSGKELFKVVQSERLYDLAEAKNIFIENYPNFDFEIITTRQQ